MDPVSRDRGDLDLFQSEEAAYRFVERCVWPAGPVCPHCHGHQRVKPLRGSSTRMGAYKCYGCRKPFTVKVGTILESSNLPMHKWLQAIFLVSGNGAAIGVNDLRRALNVTTRTASYVLRRVRNPPPALLPEPATLLGLPLAQALRGEARRELRRKA